MFAAAMAGRNGFRVASGVDEGPCSFVVQRHATVAAVLSQNNQLVTYAQAFDKAEIDLELANDMSLADITTLLPRAPMGHCLLIRKLLATNAKGVVQIPSTPSLQMTCRGIASGSQEGEQRMKLVIDMEITLIVSSLLLSISAGYSLEPTTGCGEDNECWWLRSTDTILWCSTTICNLLAMGSGWIFYVCSAVVGRAQLTPWLELNHGFYARASGLFVLGVTLWPLAMAARLMIKLEAASYPLGIKVAVFMLCMFAECVQWMIWLILGSRTSGISVLSLKWLPFQLGAMGLLAPSIRKLEPEQLGKVWVPHMGVQVQDALGRRSHAKTAFD